MKYKDIQNLIAAYNWQLSDSERFNFIDSLEYNTAKLLYDKYLNRISDVAGKCLEHQLNYYEFLDDIQCGY